VGEDGATQEQGISGSDDAMFCCECDVATSGFEDSPRNSSLSGFLTVVGEEDYNTRCGLFAGHDYCEDWRRSYEWLHSLTDGNARYVFSRTLFAICFV